MTINKPESIIVQRKLFFKISRDLTEYLKDISPAEELLQRLHGLGADIFTFLERKWCFKVADPQKNWALADDNVALMQTSTYQEWLKLIGKKTRNMLRKAEKSGVKTEVALLDDRLSEGIWKIFNETPVRQERGFPHYGMSLEAVKRDISSQPNSTFIAAYIQDELAGFIHLIRGENITIISQILSLQKHRDKAVNNALVAKTVDFCVSNNIKWIMYGRIGNHPSLDSFKQSNAFQKVTLTRYYIPLTRKGRLAIKLGLHREIKDTLPQSLKQQLFPIYNWVSRTKMRLKMHSQL